MDFGKGDLDTMKLYQSAEDYLEAILMLHQRIGLVRSIDVVNELGYSKPSVSVAMKKTAMWKWMRRVIST